MLRDQLQKQTIFTTNSSPADNLFYKVNAFEPE